MQLRSDAAISTNPSWPAALTELGLKEDSSAPAPDLALLFASSEHANLEELVGGAWERSAASVMIGCTGGGIVGPEKEVENSHALALLNLNLPGAELHPLHLETEEITSLHTAADWRSRIGLEADHVNAWIILANPFTFDAQPLIDGLSTAYPSATIVGGLASGSARADQADLFMNGVIHHSGAVVLAVGGAYTVQTVVAQGATPIGKPWTISEADRNVIKRLGDRPPLEVLRETLAGLPDLMRRRASRNLLVGIAMNEYKQSFSRGDFLIRNLMGVDQETGAMAINALPEVGQTIQFQVRDADAADEDLRERLTEARAHLQDVQPAGAMLCTCNGRGVGLFRTPDHDARAIGEILGQVPLAGFFCNGEIGPVGPGTYLHGFTASLALFVPRPNEIPAAFRF
ncbi:MAG: hypothetical protein QOF51_3483 [Chloroflexota bacterium]|nr:hypothetical protein [Chloroflexota bacterium]